MESVWSDNGGGTGGAAKTLKSGAGAAAQTLREASGQEVRNLMADVQDLLGQLAHVADPELARLRTKVEGALATAKQTLVDGTGQVQRQAKDAMAATDGYVRGQPWQAVGLAAVVGIAVGFMVGRR
jgi:ElaB/YqjD/DUF883 family membrane-anchored ribosome-binding protein